MKRLGLSWVIAAGMIGAAIKPLIFTENAKASTPVADVAESTSAIVGSTPAPALTASPTPESMAIDWNSDADADPCALLPKRAKKQALLWALDYVEGVERKIFKDPDSINPSARAIRRDAQKAADKRYPNAEQLNVLWLEFAMGEIGGLCEEAKDIFGENIVIKDALAELRQSRKERRKQINTSQEFN